MDSRRSSTEAEPREMHAYYEARAETYDEFYHGRGAAIPALTAEYLVDTFACLQRVAAACGGQVLDLAAAPVNAGVLMPRHAPAGEAVIRAATAADAEGMIDLHYAAVHRSASAFYPAEVLEHWSPLPDEERYEQMRTAIEGGELNLVAESAGVVVAFGSIVPEHAELRAVYVHPAWGRRGIGGQLLSALEQLAVSHGQDQLQLVGSLNAEAFYRRYGFEVVERGIHRLSSGHEMACIRMRKALDRGATAGVYPL